MYDLFYSAALALAIALLLGPCVIPVLRRLKFGQSIREEGPKRHLAKAGTPTMGGVIIIVAIVVATLMFAGVNIDIMLALFVTLGHGIIGFIDDFIKVVLKRSLGLKARQKIIGQVCMAFGLVYLATNYLGLNTAIWVPFMNANVDCGLWYYALVFFVLIGTTNAVNLTDGLDGLAAGTTFISAAAYAAICLCLGKHSLALFCAAVAGACLGFLKFNKYPAKVFMGDTGSLALGGALAAAAVLTKTEILLAVAGGVYVVEALSVIIQVISFKTTGKRVFLMSPIHHHFELLGWNEKKVVGVFWLAGLLCGVAALLILGLGRPGGI